MNKKRLLLIGIKQYGYSNVYYHHCKYLKKYFNISYFCFDDSLPKIEESFLNVIYIKRTKIRKFSIFSFMYSAILFLKKNEFDINIISDMYFAFLLKIFFPLRKFNLDIRVGFAGHKRIKNFIFRKKIKLNALFFKNITILSEQLAHELSLKNAKILPLGSEIMSIAEKDLHNFNLLYIGVFDNRNIDHTIKGFYKFYFEYKDKCNIKYTIAGYGSRNVTSNLVALIDQYKLNGIINFVGRVNFDQRKQLLENHNFGVSYIPKTDYFDVQPPTKTIEYLLAGMPVIATSTTKNKELISDKNGVLIEDIPEDFYNGLKILFERKLSYNPKSIIKMNKHFTWQNIVEEEYLPYLNKIINA